MNELTKKSTNNMETNENEHTTIQNLRHAVRGSFIAIRPTLRNKKNLKEPNFTPKKKNKPKVRRRNHKH